MIYLIGKKVSGMKSKNNNLQLYYSIYQTPLSELLYIYTEDEELYHIQWIVDNNYKEKLNGIILKIWDNFENQLILYFDGKLKIFDVKLYKFKYPDFTDKVLKELRKIPYGKTLSYKEVAEKLGKPSASRAVGNACKKNYFPIIIPCHRVISSSGLGGYMGKTGDSRELELKKRLLELERSFN